MNALEMTRWEYCPRCGQQEMRHREDAALECTACSYLYYHIVVADRVDRKTTALLRSEASAILMTSQLASASRTRSITHSRNSSVHLPIDQILQKPLYPLRGFGVSMS